MNKQPLSLRKIEPITITINPAIILAGFILFLIILCLGFGTIDNYNTLLSGVV